MLKFYGIPTDKIFPHEIFPAFTQVIKSVWKGKAF